MNKKRKRQILTGRVISREMSKTVNVRVTREIPHPVYKKRVKRYKNYLAHVESVAPKEGDIDNVAEGGESNIDLSNAMEAYTNAISKTKDKIKIV